MATRVELERMIAEQQRRVGLEDQRLRTAALGYDAGELDGADLLLNALRYAAEVRVYREMIEASRIAHAAVAVKPRMPEPMTPEQCIVRRGTTLQ